jgi:hypothetical protein
MKKVKKECPFGGVVGEAREKVLEYIFEVSLGFERGFKILPRNGAKMLSHKL